MADATQQAPEKKPEAEATTPAAPASPAAEAAAPAKPKAAEEGTAAKAPVQQQPEEEQDFSGLTKSNNNLPPVLPEAAPQAAAPAQPAAPKAPVVAEEEQPAAPAEEEEVQPRSKFLASGDHQKLLEAWQLKSLPEDLEESLKGGRIKRTVTGFEFTMADGKRFGWGVDARGQEFIGMKGVFSRMSPDMATAQIAAAKAHGWEEVNVHGNTTSKEMLWLAAKRAGLNVKNFEPKPNSAVAQKWEKEQNTQVRDLSKAGPDDAAPAAPTADTPAAPAADKPVADKPAADKPVAPQAAAPVVEEPIAPKADAPVASKFGGAAAEAPKVDTPAAEAPAAPAAAEAKPAKVYPQWEADKALFASKPEGQEVSTEGRKNIEAVEGMTKRAEGIKDPAHRDGVEKLQDAIKSGKVKVDNSIEREIINNVDSPKGFNKAAEYFNNKSGGDLGISKVAVETAAANNENNGQRKGGPKAKGVAP